MADREPVPVLFWQAIEARAWRAVEALLAPDFVSEWPQSGEVFDRATFILVNQMYPGDWHLRVVKVVEAGHDLVTEVEVSIDDRLDRAVSFFELRDGAIIKLREYWPEPFPIPEWRRALHR